MKKLIFILSFYFFLFQIIYAEWRPYNVYKCGAKGSGMGGAFTAIANDSSALYWNPAGIVQTIKPTIFYNFDSQIRIVTLIDTSLKVTYKIPSLIGFILPFSDSLNSTIGFNINTPFQRKIPNEFAVYEFSLTYAFQIKKHFFLGLKPNLNYATYGKAYSSDGWGISFQIGMLYFFSNKFHIGLNYHSSITIKWGYHGTIYSLKETFPDILNIGMAYLLTKKLILGIDFEYQGWNNIKFIADGIDIAPVNNIETGFLKTIHPHIGIMFLEEKTGAHIRTGLMTDSYMEADGSSKTQLVWGIGVGAYALKIIKFEASLLDTFLMKIFNKNNNNIETIQISAEYKF